ncbi:MAG: ParB/RepB/Spo0J family partition protein [Prevotella sp.]|nr:ParB/RepB/Spo0J family partition protein [Prevotella sp.]
MAVKKKFNALGRGLDALISTEEVKPQGSSTINEIPLDQIEANPNQPRREFDEETLQELANSIREIGIVQPITLRQTGNDKFQIIAGERRWRASQLAGLTTIPAYVRTINDENVMEMALVENIQREDLNAIEIALAYAHLLEQEGMTQEKVADRVGKSRVAVANYLRLLKLPAQVQMALQKRTIDMGHARALLSLDSPSQQLQVFEAIQRNGSSVRQVEELVKKIKNGEKIDLNKKKGATGNRLPEEFDILRKQLTSFFRTKISLNISPSGKGKISIPFSDEEELERIMTLLDNLRKN